MKIRINRDVTFNWKLTVEGESVDLSKLELSVEITTPSHKKVEIIPTIQFDTLVFKYRPNQIGEYIASVYINRFKDGETALDVKAFEGVRYSWSEELSNNDNLAANNVELTGNLNYGPNLDIYLKIEDTPFENGSVKNSATLKGGNNVVISESSVALGKENLVGLKGFYYKHIRFVSKTIANIYLSKIQVVPTITTNGEVKDNTIIPSDFYAIGDTISLVNDNKYDSIATINNMSNGLIQIKWINEKPFESIKKEAVLSPEDYSIYCLDKPENGIADLGQYSFANGTDNKAINTYTEVSGKGNVAKGKFAKVWGKDNVGGYNTTTFGTNNTNLADNSTVCGTNNINEGNNSVVFGNKNTNKGKRVFITGNQNETNNENEVALGQNNKSTIGHTQFSIGIGENNNRMNALEITKDGNIYIKGIGGRNEEKYEGYLLIDDFGDLYYPKSLQEIINFLIDRFDLIISDFNKRLTDLENKQ